MQSLSILQRFSRLLTFLNPFCLLLFASCLCTNTGALLKVLFIKPPRSSYVFLACTPPSRGFTYVLQAVWDGQEHLCSTSWAEHSSLCPYPTKTEHNSKCSAEAELTHPAPHWDLFSWGWSDREGQHLQWSLGSHLPRWCLYKHSLQGSQVPGS